MAAKPKPVEFQVAVSTLNRGLRNALLFAGGTHSNRVLQCILLDASDGTLRSVSTDRFTLGITVMQETPKFTFLLGPDDARLLLRLFPSTRKTAIAQLTVTVDGETLTVAPAPELSLGLPAVTVTLTAVEGEFPTWRALLEKEIEAVAGPTVGLNATYLARFARVAKVDTLAPVRITVAASTGPVKVAVGEHFTGLIMPVRLADSAAAVVKSNAA